MKTIHRFTLRAYLGPMILTFFIVMFILMMNFVWRYIDELVGKGLEFRVIVELLFYATANMMPLGIPLATLLAAIMTMGNLGENNELLAMKCAGMSLPRILSPLIVVVCMVAVGSFFVVNNLVPYSNKKMMAIIYDIRQQKQVMEFKDGQFFNGIDNMSIRVGHQDPKTKLLTDVLIYDTRDRGGNMTTTLADSGYIHLSDDKKFLMVQLFGGEMFETTRNYKWNTENIVKHNIFKVQNGTIQISGFDFSRTDMSLFNNDQTKNTAELQYDIDSLKVEANINSARSYEPLLKNYLLSKDPSTMGLFDSLRMDYSYKRPTDVMSKFERLSVRERRDVVNNAKSTARMSRNSLTYNEDAAKTVLNKLYRSQVEWHRKVSLPISVLIFFMIGAPLGAIIRKGGLAMPIVVSVLFFVIYYVVSIAGEKMAKEGSWDAAFGMWFSSIVLTPIAAYLTYKATNDSNLFNTDWYVMKWNKLVGHLVKRGKKVESKALRIVFMGTPDFAVASLKALVDSGYNVVAVVTMPDKPSGRGLKIQQSAVKQYAESVGLKVMQPEKLSSPEFVMEFHELKADLGIVIAFRMLPEIIWSAPALGTFNLHASLLPEYRGAAPINWALINGETRTGVTTFMLNARIDEGEILGRREVSVLPDDNFGTLHDKLMLQGVGLVIDTVELIASGRYRASLQRGSKRLKPAPKIFKEDCHVDFSRRGVDIVNLVRGLSPVPTAWVRLDEQQTMKIFAASFEPSDNLPAVGTILTDGRTYIKVVCADGLVNLSDVQLSGRKRMAVDELLRGFKFSENPKCF